MLKLISVLLFITATASAQHPLINRLFDEVTDDRLNVNNVLYNDGAKNTTDFVQTPASGDPDDMSLNASFSITTEGSNRLLRFVRLGGVNNYVGIQGISSGVLGGGVNVGQTYHIRIKYRSNGAKMRVIPFGAASQPFTAVTGEEIWVGSTFVCANASFYLTFNNEGDTSKYFEIDYIEVWEE